MSKAEITAIEHKILNATSTDELMAFIDEDIVRYTFLPPLQYAGAKAVRALFDQIFAMAKDAKAEFISLDVVCEGNLAVAYSLQQFTWTNPNGTPGGGTFRVTDCFHKVNGAWKIFHAHISFPINPATGQAEMSLKQ